MPVGQHRSAVPEVPDAREFEAVFKHLIKKTGVSGFSLSIIVGDSPISASAGRLVTTEPIYINSDTRFELLCAIKFIVSFLCLELATKGLINLDNPPGFYIAELGKIDSRLKVRHLLSQSSGYPGIIVKDGEARSRWTWQACVSHFTDSCPIFPPGAIYSEDSLGHILIGEIMRRVTGTSIRVLIQDLVRRVRSEPNNVLQTDNVAKGHTFEAETGRFVPRRPCLEPPEHWHAATSHVQLTPRELAQLASNFIHLYSGDWWANHIFDVVAPIPDLIFVNGSQNWQPLGFSHVWGLFPNQRWGFFGTGAGISTCTVVEPSAQLSIALAMNFVGQPRMRAAILDLIFARLLPTNRMSETNFISPSEKIRRLFKGFGAHAIMGSYHNADKEKAEVILSGDDLIISLGDSPIFAMNIRTGVTRNINKRPVSVGFFASPETAAPCLMIGLKPFVQTNSRQVPLWS